MADFRKFGPAVPKFCQYKYSNNPIPNIIGIADLQNTYPSEQHADTFQRNNAFGFKHMHQLHLSEH